MSKKRKEKRLRTRPMDVDEIAKLENLQDKTEPKSLLKLRESGKTYFTRIKGAVRSNLEASRISKSNVYELEVGEDFIEGKLGEDAKMDPRPKSTRSDKGTLEIGLPKWSGIAYHPKITGNQATQLLKRISGKKVHPHYVFGADNRQVYYPSSYPWRCIGKVETWIIAGNLKIKLGSGTGALVGTNVMLTASHMFPWFHVQSLGWGWMMKFTPAYYDGASVYGSGVYSYCQSAYGYSNHSQGDD